MSQPIDTTEDLLQKIGDPDVRRAVQGLLRRIEDLERELEVKKVQLGSAHGFLSSTFTKSFDDYSRYRGGAIPATSGAGQVDATHVGDPGALVSAQASDDFLEACRVAYKMAEATTEGLLDSTKEQAPERLKEAWDRQQSGYSQRSRKPAAPYPDDLGGVYMGIKLEVAFILLYGPSYQADRAARDRYWILVTLKEVRHLGSHGRAGGSVDEATELRTIKNDRRRSDALKLYETRKTGGYDKLAGAVTEYEADAAGFVSGLAE